MSTKSPEAVDIHVGAMIRSQRRALGMSQTALGDKPDVAFQQVQKYEKGSNRVSSSQLAKIADALGVEPSFFFPRNGKSNTEVPEAVTLTSTIGATNLLRAISKIEDNNVRQSIVALVESVARNPKVYVPVPGAVPIVGDVRGVERGDPDQSGNGPVRLGAA